MRTLKLTASETGIAGKYEAGEMVLVLCDASDDAFTVTLPSAQSAESSIFIVKKTDSSSNAVTVATSENQTIDGASTLSLSSQYDSRILVQGENEYHIAHV